MKIWRNVAESRTLHGPPNGWKTQLTYVWWRKISAPHGGLRSFQKNHAQNWKLKWQAGINLINACKRNRSNSKSVCNIRKMAYHEFRFSAATQSNFPAYIIPISGLRPRTSHRARITYKSTCTCMESAYTKSAMVYLVRKLLTNRKHLEFPQSTHARSHVHAQLK